MKKSIYQSEIMLDMNTRLFHNTLAGVAEEQAKERISAHNNPFIWIAAHTVWARYNISNIMGAHVINPYHDILGSGKPYTTEEKYPTLEEVKNEWDKATTLLKNTIASVSEEHLAAESHFKSPIGDHTNGGSVAFLTQHESYEIGQMAFLKKYITQEAMSYK